METPILTIWTIYDSPKDFPGEYVARRFNLDKATEVFIRCSNLDELRAKVINLFDYEPYRIPRSASDNPAIIESYV
jgi:hypothetical protein